MSRSIRQAIADRGPVQQPPRASRTHPPARRPAPTLNGGITGGDRLSAGNAHRGYRAMAVLVDAVAIGRLVRCFRISRGWGMYGGCCRDVALAPLGVVALRTERREPTRPETDQGRLERRRDDSDDDRIPCNSCSRARVGSGAVRRSREGRQQVGGQGRARRCARCGSAMATAITQIGDDVSPGSATRRVLATWSGRDGALRW